MSEVTVFILLDGFKYDYLKYAPYMSALEGAYLAKIKEPFGFLSTRPAIFAGLWPEQSGLCNFLYYSPETSPFKHPLCRMEIKNKRLERFYRYLIAFGVRCVSAYSGVRESASTLNIPLRLINNFDFPEKKIQYEPGYLSAKTLFDLLREYHKDFLYLGYCHRRSLPELFKDALSKEIHRDFYAVERELMADFRKGIKKSTSDFIHIHFSLTDWIGHRFGPNSQEVRQAAGFLDGQIREIHHLLKENYSLVNLIISADHGMTEVINYVDMTAKLDELPIKLGSDYLFFLDSTMARFWFKRQKARESVEDLLSKLSLGRVLNESDLEKFKIRFGHSKYGELIWVAKPGILIYPNFFQTRGRPCKGMHGYCPDDQEADGVLMISPAEKRVFSPAPYIQPWDLFPTLLDFLSLPIPSSNQGVSLLAG